MKVFGAKEKEYKTNGLGFIKPLKCIETKKKSLNGWYVEATVSSEYSDIIINDNIIVIETKEKGSQPFRIKNPETNDSVISFTADHVVFDAARYTVDDVRPTNLIGAEFLEYINARLDTTSPFSFDSDIPTRKTSYFIRKDFLTVLEETEETFEGEYDVDNYHVDMKSSVSRMSDECLIYGKNIQGLKKYEDWSEVCTKILPEGPDGLLLPEVYITADVQYDIPYTRNVSFSLQTKKEDDTEKTEAELITELRASAISFLNEHKYPKVNYTVTSDINQGLAIGDIIPVKHPLATIKTAVQEYRYDVLKKRVISIVYGNYERNVKKAFGNITNQIEQLEKKSSNFLTEAMNTVAYLMNIAGKNGSIVFRKNNKGVIYEILAMDTDSMETAKIVMRLNNQGLAGSTNGVNGPFNVAVMANGSITADAILSGILRSIEIMNGDGSFRVDKQGNVTIKKGTLDLGEGNFHVDQYGNTSIKKGSFNIGGKFIVTEDGSMTARDGNFAGTVTAGKGEIAGFLINQNSISKTQVTTYNYSQADIDRIKNIIIGNISPTASDYARLDITGDGLITAMDYTIIRNMVEMYGNNLNTSISISNNTKDGYITVKNNTTGTTIFKIGYHSVNVNVLSAALQIITSDITSPRGDLNISSAGVIRANKNIWAPGFRIDGSGTSRSIACKWADGETHDIVSIGGDNLNNYHGPTDGVGETTTNLRGKYVKLYNHSGGYCRVNGAAITSDKNLKSDFRTFGEEHERFFEYLHPKVFKYKNGTAKRDHFGFVAQDVEAALADAGLSTNDFAGVIIDRNISRTEDDADVNSLVDEGFTEMHLLRMEEFIALNTHMIQKAYKRLEELEHKTESLEQQLEEKKKDGR